VNPGLGDAAAAFVALFVILDPPGTALIFAGLTPRASPGERRATARRAVGIAAIVLVLFAVGGDWLLRALGVGLPAFRVAGGVLLFLIAVDMVFSHQLGFRSLTHDERGEAGASPDISVFPLAIPLIAGPGALTTMVILMGRTDGHPSQVALLLFTLAAVLAITYVLLVTADAVGRRLGTTGVNVVSRVLGILLAAIAAQLVIDGALAALAR
jgi:multiple antibiotic resistance protein